MTTEKGPRKSSPDKSPGRKDVPVRETPATHPHKKPQIEPPRPWPRTPQSR